MENRNCVDILDKIIAALYLGMGYLFIWMFTASAPDWSLSGFTILYAGMVLGYLYSKRKTPSKESWFWLAVMLLIGIPITFYSVFPLIQILALIGVAEDSVKKYVGDGSNYIVKYSY